MHIKKCSKCGEYKDLSAFMEAERFTIGRYCVECKRKPVSKSTPIEINKFMEEKTICYASSAKNRAASSDIDFSIGTQPKNIKSIVLKAISDKDRLKIIYRSRYNRKTTREISPLSLVGDYLRAYCHLRNEERTFRLSSIKSIFT